MNIVLVVIKHCDSTIKKEMKIIKTRSNLNNEIHFDVETVNHSHKMKIGSFVESMK